MITGFNLRLDTTTWFSKEILPVRDGVYMTKVVLGTGFMKEGFSKWSAEFGWGFQAESRVEVEEPFYLPQNCFQSEPKAWMGLAASPDFPFLNPTSMECKILHEMSKEMDLSERGVYRQGLMLYQSVTEAHKKGHTMLFVDSKGKPVRGLSKKVVH